MKNFSVNAKEKLKQKLAPIFIESQTAQPFFDDFYEEFQIEDAIKKQEHDDHAKLKLISIKKFFSAKDHLTSEQLPSKCIDFTSIQPSSDNVILEGQKNKIKEGTGSFLILLPEKFIHKVNRKKPKKFIQKIFAFGVIIHYYTTHVCKKIVKNPIFETLSLLVIIINSVMLALETPDGKKTSQELKASNSIASTENLFLILYTIEMLLKIIALGFILNKNAYLRDFWNILDFTIVATGYLSVIFQDSAGSISYLASLRSLRVLRPLRTISSIKNLKNIISTVISSMPYFIDIAIVILFFFLIMAIAGLQLFSNQLKYRCVELETGNINNDYLVCGSNLECSDGLICGLTYQNPNYGVTNFDNIFSSFLMVFQTVTLEGWSDIMRYLTASVSKLVVVYFLIVVMIGAYFLLNLTLAVIIVKFNENSNKKKINKNFEEIIEKEQTPEEKFHDQLRKYEDGVDLLLLKEFYPYLGQRFLKIKLKVQKKMIKQKRESILPLRQKSTTSRSSVETHHKEISTPSQNYVNINHINFNGIMDLSKPKRFYKNALSNKIKDNNFEELDGIISDNNNDNLEEMINQSIIGENSHRLADSEFEIKTIIEKDIISSARSQNNMTTIFATEGYQQSLSEMETNNNFLNDQNANTLNSNEIKKIKSIDLDEIVEVNGIRESMSSINDSSISSDEDDLDESVNEKSTPNNKVTQKNDPNHKTNAILEWAESFKNFVFKNKNAYSNQNILGIQHLVEADKKVIISPGREESYLNESIDKLIQENPTTAKSSDMSAENDRKPIKRSKSKKLSLGQSSKFQRKTKFKIAAIKNSVLKDKLIERVLKIFAKKKFRTEINFAKKYSPINKYDSAEDVMPLQDQIKKDREDFIFQETIKKCKLPLQYTDSRPNSVESKKFSKNNYLKYSLKEQKLTAHKNQHILFGASGFHKIPLYTNKNNHNKIQPIHVSSTFSNDQITNTSSRIISPCNSNQEHPVRIPRSNTRTRSMIITNTNKTPASVQSSSYLDFKEIQVLFSAPVKKMLNADFHSDTNINNVELYTQFRKLDFEKKAVQSINFSGENVLATTIYDKKIKRIINSLNNQNFNIWEIGMLGFFQAIRRKIKGFIDNKIIENFIMILVFINTLILASDGLLADSWANTLNTLNMLFTGIFTAEMVLKIIGYGPSNYTRDFFNIFDAVIVILSIVELMIKIQSGNSQSSNAFSAFRAARLFRTFRVLRVTRLLRSLRFMKVIIEVVTASLTDFFYIALLLFIFIFIFTLLGMQMFGGFFVTNDGQQSRINFDSFYKAFLAVFQLLTVENWNNILFTLMTSDANSILGIIYLIMWILIGNFIFLNLFLAALLDGFTTNELTTKIAEIKSDEEEIDELNKKVLEESKKLSKKDDETIQESIISPTAIVQQKFDFDRDDLSTKKIVQNAMADVQCSSSFFFFSKENKIRILGAKITSHKHFEKVIIFLIVLGSLKLVAETYITSDSAIADKIEIPFLILDYFFTISFSLEALLKMIKYGVVFCPNSYLRDSWSCLDFIIVITSILDLSLTGANLKYLKVLRLLRTLRPLRFISHNRNMKLVVTALFESMNAILNVAVVILFVWLMFGILGVNIMQDKLYYCDIDDPYNVTKENCTDMGFVWKTRDYNFDNIFNALQMLFVISTLENWPDLMYMSMDGSSDGPILDNSKYFGIYFIIFILFSSFFLMNLFIGVIFMNYEREQNKEKNKKYSFLTNDQIKWIHMQSLIVKAKPDFNLSQVPKNKIQKFLFNLIKSKIFESLIMLCIVFNIITMGMFYVGANLVYLSILEKINLFFTSVFILEAILKMIGLGLKAYICNPWNQFDLIVVLSSLVDIIMGLMGQNFMKALRVGPQIARVLRVLRVTRLFKLMKSKSLEGISKIINVMKYAFPSMLNILALLFIVFFIYSILGVFIFQGTDFGNNTLINFNNFGNALLSLFICSTGENWPIIMNVIKENNEGFSKIVPVLYFFSFIAQCTFVLMNMFVLIVIQNFEQLYFNPENPIDTFSDILAGFRQTWNKYSEKYKGKKINSSLLVEFFSNLETPYGYKEPVEDDAYEKDELVTVIPKAEIAKAVWAMQLPIDDNGCVLFGVVLHAALKNAFGASSLKNTSPEAFKVIKEKEWQSINKILSKGKSLKKNKNGKKDHLLFKTANPLIQLLMVKMTINSWSKYAKNNYDSIMQKRKLKKLKSLKKNEENQNEENDINFGQQDDENFSPNARANLEEYVLHHTKTYENTNEP